MFIIGIIVGMIGAAIGVVGGLVGGFFGLLGGLLGVAGPLMPIAMIVGGVIWLVSRPTPPHTAPAAANGGARIPPQGRTNTQ